MRRILPIAVLVAIALSSAAGAHGQEPGLGSAAVGGHGVVERAPASADRPLTREAIRRATRKVLRADGFTPGRLTCRLLSARSGSCEIRATERVPPVAPGGGDDLVAWRGEAEIRGLRRLSVHYSLTSADQG